MFFRTSRSPLLLTFASVVLVSACALPGRGDGGSDDDDGGSQQENLTTTGPGTGSGGAGSGGASSSSTGDSTTAPSSTGSLNGSTSSTSGSTSSTSTGGSTCPTTTLEFTDPVCGDCMATACCAPLQTCDGSFDCLDFLGCYQSCTDQLCVDSCVEIYPYGADEYLNLDDCLLNSCSFECGA